MRSSSPPMTLGNMRASGVRTLAGWCSGRGCNHCVAVERFGNDAPVRHSACPRGPPACCHLRADARPNGSERPGNPNMRG